MCRALLATLFALCLVVVSSATALPSSTQQRGITTRVNLASDGTQATTDDPWNLKNLKGSTNPVISADGRYVAFLSYAVNLVPGDTNDAGDIFVHDRETGETSRVSVTSTDAQLEYGVQDGPSISADGRFVAFSAYDERGIPELFVHDRQMKETSRLAVNLPGIGAGGSSWNPVISGDGRFVAFHYSPTHDFASAQVAVYDRQTGQSSLASVTSDGTLANSAAHFPDISADGRYVTFVSMASNLAPATQHFQSIYLRDRQAGTTTRISVTSQGTPADYDSYRASISDDGRYVAFSSAAGNLADNESLGKENIYVRDRSANKTIRVSLPMDTTNSSHYSTYPQISGDGRYVAFTSNVESLVSDDTNQMPDAFVQDLQTGETTLISVASDGTQGNFGSSASSLSGDGRFIAFSSFATTLVADDTNGESDIFVHDRTPDDVCPMATTGRAVQALSGQVLWGPSYEQIGLGVSGAEVQVGCATATTDDQGHFSLSVAPGSYTMQVRLALFSDHKDGEETIAAAWVEKQVPVTIAAGATELPTVAGFGNKVKLSVLGETTDVVDAAITLQGFSGKFNLLFSQEPNATPLPVQVAYTKSNNRLTLTGGTDTAFTFAGQSLTLSSFTYESPTNTGALKASGIFLGHAATIEAELKRAALDGTIQLHFSNEPEADPLALKLHYDLASKTLDLSSSTDAIFSWYGQMVTLTSFSYAYPANALTIQGTSALNLNGVIFNGEVVGLLSGGTLVLRASGTATINGVEVTFQEVTIEARAFRVSGTIHLPGDPPDKVAASFDTSIATGNATLDLMLDDFTFANYPAQVVLKLGSNPAFASMAGSGKVEIGGQIVNAQIAGTINAGKTTLDAQATLTIDKGSATVNVIFNWITGTLTGTGKLIYLAQPCPDQAPVRHHIALTATQKDVTLSANTILFVDCAGTQIGVSLVVNQTGDLTKFAAGIPVTINGQPGKASLTATASATHIELWLTFEWKFGPAPQQRLANVQQASSPVRLLLTDPVGRRIGYDRASDTVINEIPGARYEGLVNGIDSFTLPGRVGGYAVEVIGSGDGTVMLQSSDTTGAASVEYPVTFQAGQSVQLVAGVAPHADGSLAFAIRERRHILHLPAVQR